VGFSFSNDFSSDDLISFHHFHSEYVVYLDVMSGDPVVEEGGWEHHVVPSIPELWVVLGVEGHGVSYSDESESGDDESRQPEPHEETGIVERTAGNSDKPGEHRSHHRERMVNTYPEKVCHSEGLVHRVRTVLSRPHLQALEHPPNKTRSLPQTLIHKVLERSCVP